MCQFNLAAYLPRFKFLWDMCKSEKYLDDNLWKCLAVALIPTSLRTQAQQKFSTYIAEHPWSFTGIHEPWFLAVERDNLRLLVLHIHSNSGQAAWPSYVEMAQLWWCWMDFHLISSGSTLSTPVEGGRGLNETSREMGKEIWFPRQSMIKLLLSSQCWLLTFASSQCC